jgi:polar amino acid transport system substrate-binding protein
MKSVYFMSIFGRLALLSVLLLPTLAGADDFRVIGHELRPFIWSDRQGHLHGSSYDLVVAILGRLGQDSAAIEYYPFARALRTMETRANVAVFPVARTPDREHSFKWVGPISSGGVYLYTGISNTIPLNSLEDAKALRRIGVGNGNASMDLLQKAGFKNLVPTNDEEMLIKMLLSGRVDAAPVGERVMDSVIKENHFDEKQVVKTKVKLFDSSLYVAFSLSTPDDVIAKWQAAFEAVKPREE